MKRQTFAFWIALITLTLFLTSLITPFASGANVKRELPNFIETNKLFKVNISIDFAYLQKEASFSETLPSGFLLRTWEINGIKENPDTLSVKIKGNTYTWNFTPTNTTVVLSYFTSSPATEGQFTITGEVTDWSVKSTTSGNITVKKQNCGDGICDASENTASCPADCKASNTSSTVTAQPVTPPTSTTVRRTTTTTTTSSDSSTPGSEIFANKKKSSNSSGIILLIGLAVIGVVGYGVFMQMKKGKMKSGLVQKDSTQTTAQEVKDTLTRLKDSVINKDAIRKEKAEMASSELPTFTERTSRLEIPTMPSELRKMQDVQMSIPPMPKNQNAPSSMSTHLLPKQNSLNLSPNAISNGTKKISAVLHKAPLSINPSQTKTNFDSSKHPYIPQDDKTHTNSLKNEESKSEQASSKNEIKDVTDKDIDDILNKAIKK